MLLMGIGLGLIIQTLLIAAQKAAPVEYMASATTLFMFMRVLGSSVGIAILQSVLQNTVIPKLDFLSARYPEYARVFSSSLNDQGAIYNSGLPDGIRIELIHYYVQALQRVFIGGAAFTGVGFLLVLGLGHIPFSRKVRQTTQ
ncbi:hypothetical protein GGH17_000520 [Coemansia sp. RSA 788]|nr:hypothetical protein GGH17_000520 [Coemansia sp. RSA 788]KAJ2291971.1 hypothetical protein IW141_002251 [Coemansia sp. RSA 355]KAJ2407941.1 hypothetical protein J3F80_002443 [Coemansia sp. RSA 2526]